MGSCTYLCLYVFLQNKTEKEKDLSFLFADSQIDEITTFIKTNYLHISPWFFQINPCQEFFFRDPFIILTILWRKETDCYFLSFVCLASNNFQFQYWNAKSRERWSLYHYGRTCNSIPQFLPLPEREYYSLPLLIFLHGDHKNVKISLLS